MKGGESSVFIREDVERALAEMSSSLSQWWTTVSCFATVCVY